MILYTNNLLTSNKQPVFIKKYTVVYILCCMCLGCKRIFLIQKTGLIRLIEVIGIQNNSYLKHLNN